VHDGNHKTLADCELSVKCSTHKEYVAIEHDVNRSFSFMLSDSFPEPASKFPLRPVLPQASLQKSLDSKKNSLDLKKITTFKTFWVEVGSFA